MGIPRLMGSLEPYGVRSQLSGSVVIDGPAFAYRILHICRGECKTTGPLSEPTYQQLSQAALRWLDGIQECGVRIAAIYFDGYLPVSKRNVRLERVFSISSTLSTYYSSTSSGIPSLSLSHDSKEILDPFHPLRAATSRSKNHLPIPPLLVPAILDGLRASGRYSGLTHLVPGEADTFCASLVKQHGGIILTSDSDLLLYNLGSEGSVVFFKDVDNNNASENVKSSTRGLEIESTLTSVSGLVFTTKHLMERLSLVAEDGLLSLGFELQMDPYPPFSEVVKRSKVKHSSSKNLDEYNEFVSQYRLTLPVDLGMPLYLSSLDPRVSEFILQWTGDAAAYSAEVGGLPDREITIFLPPLLDRWDRTSAWESSVSIRQVAYGLMNLYNLRKGLSSVAEYRRAQSKVSKGRQIPLPQPAELVESSKDLLASIEKIKKNLKLQHLQWIVLSMDQDLLQAKELEKEALTLEQWRLAAKCNGQLDITSWDTIHLAAQVQGYLYSLRILQQVLGFLQQVFGDALPKHQTELKVELTSLPTISQFPTIGDLSTIFVRLKQSGGLDMLRKTADLASDIPFETPRGRKPRKKNRDKKTNRSTIQHRAAASLRNPFDVLG